MAQQPKKYVRPVLNVGDVILNGSYQIVKILAQGTGMSNVYVVSDTRSGKFWALKQIYDYRIFQDSVSAKQHKKNELEYLALAREATVMNSLSHPGIPRIINIMDDSNIHSRFIIMDYVEGISTSAVLQDKKTIPQDMAVSWGVQIATILMYLHSLKTPMAYRDIKPSNLILTKNNSINLIDFGTAEFIEERGQLPLNTVGTKGYAPLEQKTKGHPLDTRSDIYALGVTLGQWLTGVSPTAVDDNGETYFKDSEPFSIRSIDPALSRGLEEVIKRCTQPDLSLRYQHMEEVYDALKNYNKLDAGYRKRQKKKINTVIALGVATVVCAVGSVGSYAINASEQGQKYNNALSVANQTGRVDDYVTAIDMEPLKLKPYEGLINAIKQDGDFSTEEEEKLLGLLNPNISDIKDEGDYGNLAYEVGRLYWFYYKSDEGETQEGKVLSTKWFEDAIDEDAGEGDLATVYYNIGMFDKTISSSIQESDDAGEYKKYWSNLIKAQNSENGEVIDLQIYNTIASCIDNYSYRLKTDGVSQKEVESEIQKIDTYLRNNKPSVGAPTELYDQLKKSSTELQDKVDLAYKSEG